MEFAPGFDWALGATLFCAALIAVFFVIGLCWSQAGKASERSGRPLDVERARSLLAEIRCLISRAARDTREHDVLLEEAQGELTGVLKDEAISLDETETRLRATAATIRQANDKVRESLNEINLRLQFQKEQIDCYGSKTQMDPLTGLVNRAAFDDQLQKWSGRWLRGELPVCLAIVAFDNKQRIGDRLGPTAEQFLFHEAAKIVGGQVRMSDVVARYSESELALLFPGFHLEEAGQLAERVRAAVAGQPLRYQGFERKATLSIGIAEGRKQTAELLARGAEDACRMAQRGGGNAVYVHDGRAGRPLAAKADEEAAHGGKSGRERRRHPRRPFRMSQFLAVCKNNRLPKAKDFEQVQCNDISPGGCSFFLDRPPEWEYVVVGLGTPPNLMYFHARVRHVTPVTEGNRTMLRVGCEFTARLNPEQFGVEPNQIARPTLAIVTGKFETKPAAVEAG